MCTACAGGFGEGLGLVRGLWLFLYLDCQCEHPDMAIAPVVRRGTMDQFSQANAARFDLRESSKNQIINAERNSIDFFLQ